jgi:hypothetical protein
MTVHDHDPDLIAAYAVGDLGPGADQVTAARLVEECADCRSEFELQRTIRGLLEAAPAVRLSADERVSLHHAVMAGVGRRGTLVSLDERRLRRRVAFASAAAALLVVVGLGGVLSQLGGRDGANVAAEEAGAADALRSAAADTVAAETTTTAAAGIQEMAPMGGGHEPVLSDLGALALPELAEAAAAAVVSAETAPESTVFDADFFNDREQRVPECFGRAGSPVVGALFALVDGEAVQVFIVGTAEGGYRAEAFWVEGCRPLPLG